MQRLDDPFYPVTAPRTEGLMDRGDGHMIYWQETGARDGLPLIICHGGPGGSTTDSYRRFIDASAYRIVQFDQHGCGRSQPPGALDCNTLQATIGDMEAIREHLSIERWVVAGGSWGAAVALAYAEAHPGRCLGLNLIGMWLLRRRDIEWWFAGVRALFPELHDDFASYIPKSERGDLRKAYCARILGPDSVVASEAAIRLFFYEEGFMHFDAPLTPPDAERGAAYGQIFAHYAAHDFFLHEDQLIKDAHRVAHLPALLVTGRYDCCTTPENAYDLKQLLPNAELRIIGAAGHYPTEQMLATAVAHASNDLWRRVRDAISDGL